MLTLTVVLLVLNLVGLGLLLWRQQGLLREAAATSVALGELPAAQLSAPELALLLGAGKREVIVIEVLNPMELAAKESWFAEKFGALTPELVRKIVHARTLEILGKQLESFGVKADVRLHRAA